MDNFAQGTAGAFCPVHNADDRFVAIMSIVEKAAGNEYVVTKARIVGDEIGNTFGDMDDANDLLLTAFDDFNDLAFRSFPFSGRENTTFTMSL